MTSKQAQWAQLRISLPADRVEQAEAALFELGAASVTLLDAEDQPVHEPDPGEVRLWPEVVVQGLFAASDLDRETLVQGLIAAGVVASASDIAFADLAEQNWARAWMDQYQPLRFGHGLWICPSHIEPDPDWSLVIRLDPGLAFGSGTHPTTAMCLEWIDGARLDGRRVIDFGCGSGILAIAAALKGASRVIAVDHDPQALLATTDNAGRNGVADRISCLAPADFRPEPADCVLANILAGPLIELAPLLSGCVAAGGSLVLSGILSEQAESVSAAYRSDLGEPALTRQEDWVRLVFQASGAGP
jgi:ribosomal protein L11 methyltransferase